MAETTTSTGSEKQLSLLGRAATRGKAREARRTARNTAKQDRRTSRRDRRAGPQTPTTEERLEPIAEATQTLAEVGQESLEGERGVQEENLEAAQTESDRQQAGQEAALGKFDEADTAAQAGLEGIQGEIQDTRDLVDALPGKVRDEFDFQRRSLDASLDQARTGLEGKSGDALAAVMTGRAGAMEAATASIHGATREQMSNIDAQVQQGTLSPSQATAMKAKIRMGASMQLSAAVGQTAHAFTQTQAQVATSFGNMFTSFEGTAAQVTGQFGTAAAGAFGQAQAASAQFNVALTNLDAQATASRDAMLSTNATARSVAQNMNDNAGTAMMAYTEDTYISEYPYAVNNLTAITDLMNSYIRSDEFQKVVANMDKAAKAEWMRGLLGVGGTILQNIL